MLELKNVTRRITALILSAVMAWTFLPVQINAEEIDSPEVVEANEETGDVEKEFGDLEQKEPDFYDPVIIVRAEDDATATVTTGSLTNEDHLRGNGLSVSTHDGNANVTVNGDIDAGSLEDPRHYAAVKVRNDDGNVDITVNGDVKTGGISADTDNGTNDIVVNGDVSGKIGIDADTTGGGKTNIYVDGDVSTETGIESSIDDPGSRCSIVVNGTVHGKKAAVKGPGSGTTVTVWKAESESGNIARNEEKVQYIIKVEQSRGATLTAADEKGNALATVTAANGKSFEYAHSGDKVLLKVDVDDDYKLDAVYGDDGQKYPLAKDDKGDYYIVVPVGGGVKFSAVLTKTKKDKDDDSSSDDNKNSNSTPGNVPSAGTVTSTNGKVTISGNTAAGAANATDPAFSSQVVSMIASVPAGGELSLNVTGAGAFVDETMLNALIARKDVSARFNFTYMGVPYVIRIPAGYNLAALIELFGVKVA